jgi:hypothetical protein
MSEQTLLAASTFGLFHQTRAGMVHVSGTTDNAGVSEFLLWSQLEVFGSRHPSPYLVTFPWLACVTSSQWSRRTRYRIDLFSECFAFPFALYFIPKLWAVAKESLFVWVYQSNLPAIQQSHNKLANSTFCHGLLNKRTKCDVCLFFPDRLIDSMTTKVFDHEAKYALEGLMHVLPLSKKKYKSKILLGSVR